MRDGDWKLIEFYHWDKVEFYNLKDDPGEQRDPSKENLEKAKELLAKLHVWQKIMGAKMSPPISPRSVQR